MKIGVPKEIFAGEKRVATTPDVATQLIKMGFDVSVQSGAGDAANFSDDSYREVGCTVVPDAASIWGDSDIILKVRGPEPMEADQLKAGQTLMSIWFGLENGLAGPNTSPSEFAPTFNVTATLNGSNASGRATASAPASCAFDWTAELQN